MDCLVREISLEYEASTKRTLAWEPLALPVRRQTDCVLRLAH
jgi:hypothetical protein